MRRLLPIIFALYNTNVIAQVTFEEAANAARSVPLPAFESLITTEKMNATLPAASFGDTAPLSSLRGEKGMGDTRAPGLEKAQACDAKNDPECLAIQMLRYGSANRPALDEIERQKLTHIYEEMKDLSPTLLGDLAALSHTERICEKVETQIPGASATHVCDVTTGTESFDGTCTEGWDEERSTRIDYACSMTALKENNVCSVTTTEVTHEANVFHCTDRKATVETQTCDVPVTVDVTKTFPYTCPVTRASDTTKICVKTLDVVVTPHCNDSQIPTASIDFDEFVKLYGYTGNSITSRLTVKLACTTSRESLSLSFLIAGGVVATTTTLPFETQITYLDFPMVIRARESWIDREPYVEFSITNVDTGTGTTTITGTVKHAIRTEQTWDEWSETCEEVAP